MKIKYRLFIVILMVLFFTLTSGFYHQISDILPGEFPKGDYTFNGEVNIIGNPNSTDIFNIVDNNSVSIFKINNEGSILLKNGVSLEMDSNDRAVINAQGIMLNYGRINIIDDEIKIKGFEGLDIVQFQDLYGTPKLRINESGNVGINKANPEYNLDIIGLFQIDTPDSPLHASRILFGTSAFNAPTGKIPIIAVSQQRGVYISGKDNADLPGLYLFGGYNGQAGMGSFVGGDMQTHYAIGSPNATTVNPALIRFHPSGKMFFHSDYNITKGDFSPTSRMVIDGETGNVGIGTINPSVSLEIVCPSGFLNVKNGNNQLGCIQSTEENINIWEDASADCFISYGGRLPTSSELYLSMSNLVLAEETDDWEWTANHGSGSDRHVIAANGSINTTDQSIETVARPYRCWIPR